MSDSENDMSVSGSGNEDEDVEMEDPDNDDIIEGDEEGPASDGDGDMMSDELANKWFQKEIWQLKKLPYSKEIEEQANKHWGNIKAGIASAILLNDPHIGLLQWILELERYIELYGRRFPKEDHILLVKTLLIMVKPKQLFRDVKIAVHCLVALLTRRDFLVRGDIIIEWEPLYQLYTEIMYKNLEEEGLFLLPHDFKTEVHTLIFYARHYFSDDAPQEILDKIRPYMCPWDESIVRAWRLLDLFMPMNFPAQVQLEKGAGLWLDEAWHWYTVIENNSLIELNILKMFARLSYEATGFVDWSEKLDIIFTKLVRSLRLAIVVGLCQNFSYEQGALFFSYLLGTAAHQKALEHLTSLLKLVESYVHPSNYGNHSAPIILFFQKLLHSVVLRVKRERAQKINKPKTNNPVPEECKLKQENLDELITMMLPCLKLLIFSKTNTNEVTQLIRNACALSPKIVLPAILDVVYPALETLTEPHRLLQALQALVSTSPSLVKDKDNRIHAITLLNHLLPGLDKNDMAKSMVTFQFVGIMVNLIPIVDCSDAVHLRNDLTEEEKELCSATANFENIIALFMDKLLGMLLDHGESASTTGQHGSIASKGKINMEDNILHRGTISVFKGIFRNTSTALYKFAIDRIYNFISENVFDSKVVCDAVGDMIFVANRCYPEIAFPLFFKLVLRNLKEHLTPEIYLEEKPEFTIMWWLSLASRVVKVPSKILLQYWDEVKELLELVVQFSKYNDATERSCMVIENILESLCNLYIEDTCRRRIDLDKPLDEYFPIRHWAEPVDKNNWDIKWFVPTKESIGKAEELFHLYYVPNCEALRNPKGMDKKEMLVRLWRIRHMISGAGYSIPLFEGSLIRLTDSPTFHTDQHLICKPTGTPELSLNGKSIRDELLDVLTLLLEHIEANSEDDVKSIGEIIVLLNALENFRGISRDVYNHAVNNYKVTKLILSDKISGNRANIELLCEDFIYLQHKLRVSALCGYLYREQNARIIRMLIKLSTSFYSQIRIKAQQVVLNIIKGHPFSYKLFLSDIVAYLRPENNSTHEQIKGALHLLIEGRRHSLCMRASFDSQLLCWCAIILTKHSEKPSIIQLLEMAQNTIVESYESYRINWLIYPEMKKLAKELLLRKTDSPVNPTRGEPSVAELVANENNLEVLREQLTNGYYNLGDKLLELAQSTDLHWKQVDMAQAMMSLLVRRDMPLKTPMIRAFMKLVVHDSIKTRKIATAVVASWLRINKPKAVKRDFFIKNPPKPAEHCAPTKWPIKYGVRSDNRDMMYEEEKMPKTDEEWDKFQFVGKQHWGFYVWPKKFKTYAPLEEQVAIDRTEADFTDDEKMILEIFRDPEFLRKLKAFYTVEEKKGEDMFNAVNFIFFQGMIRVFNDTVCPIYESLLEELIPSTRGADHRLAAELIGGLINGSKLWKHARQRHMWNWLGPLLTRALENVKDENMRNWGVCLATVCGSAEPRMLKPLLDILFNLLSRPTDSAFVSNARLFLLQGALCQFEWRAMELWNKFTDILKTYIVCNYANLRDRVAVCLVSSAYYDIATVYVDPSVPKNLRPPRTADMVGAYGAYLGPCWDEIRLCSFDGAEIESEVKKQSRLAMKGLISFANNMILNSFTALNPAILNMIPLFCHYINDVGEEELQRSCSRFVRELLQAVYILGENFQHAINNATHVLKSQECWWKSKVGLLGILRSLIVANLYGFEKHKEEIGELICGTMIDAQIEVREASAIAFSNLVLSGFFNITSTLVEKFMHDASSTDIKQRHGGVLGLSAIVLASPYTVPSYLPDILMKLCRFASHANPIKDTVKRTLSEFKRTHLDSWREHEAHFNEDQLGVLRDLLISPNYYV